MNRSVALLLLTATACVPAGPPSAPPPPRAPVAAPAPVPPSPALGPDWRDWPLTPGSWSYSRDARGSTALFGEAGSGALLALRCDLPERRIHLSVTGAPAGPATLRTTSTARTVPLQPGGAQAATALTATDPILDALAFSRGRFTVEQPGRAPLVLPAHAELGRVTEDCRG